MRARIKALLVEQCYSGRVHPIAVTRENFGCHFMANSTEECRSEFEACARDVRRSQAPEVHRVSIDTRTFGEWRRRLSRLDAPGLAF